MEKIDNSLRTRCEIWTRAMGYIQRTSNFNIGKQSEFKARKFYIESKALSNEPIEDARLAA
jgi:hypothetical protein